jgi:endoplasmic reticulum Man9GlcNAc2 1,2-alpha-mannosidase
MTLPDPNAGESANNKLRPETLESMYYLWYYSGDDKYRQWARDIFMAL